MIKTFPRINVAGVAAAVPKRRVELRSLAERFGATDISRIKRATGVSAMRVSDPEMTAADLSFAAARELMANLGVTPAEIDALVFVTTTPDFLAPPTSHILQDRLGLPTSAPCFDLTFGCSGYIYGLLQAALLLHSQVARRVLLLVGDTPTKAVRPDDRATSPLFGDAGSASLLDATGDTDLVLCAHSDGSGYRHIFCPGSGYRKTPEPPGVILEGMAVHNFAMSRVPASIREVLECSGTPISEIDCFLFHQASAIILDCLIEKLALPKDKILWSLAEFGNTGAASIPLTLVVDPRAAVVAKKRVLASGFGIGLSWGAAQFSLERAKLCPLVEL